MVVHGTGFGQRLTFMANLANLTSLLSCNLGKTQLAPSD